MRVNMPVSQREVALPDDTMLVSTTDAQGRITHCNATFVAVSGFSYAELLGQPHNIVRHPDMPEEAFRDLWATVGRGRPWSGIVKNRCKNGDHYWVHANVTPVVREGRNVGYISVRLKPSREDIQRAEALYAQLRAPESATACIRLHAGGVRPVGWRDLPNRLFRLSLSQRMAGVLALWGAAAWAATVAASGTAFAPVVDTAAWLLGGLSLLTWFHKTVSAPLAHCTEVTAGIAGCNLQGDLSYDVRHPVGRLLRNVRLVNLNMQAIVEDVHAEVTGITDAAGEIAKGSQDLAARTEEQSASVERTASAMEEITSVVQHTADAAKRVETNTVAARETVTAGGSSVGDLVHTMKSIDAASGRVTEVIQVIDDIAFQTNILALNAAVEAARAGEHGRGFSVVAAEVRALSVRCADATKEIRSLIHASSDQVSTGTVHVNTAAEVISKVVKSVDEVSTLVEEITLATREQSDGVLEVHRAIGEFERTTQQNAALAEQTAAASECLKLRAGTLNRSVQIFR